MNILVNYNAYATFSKYESLYFGSSVDLPELIMGPTYVPLRSMFQGIEKRPQPEMVHNILFSTGGADELHLCLSIVKHLVEQGENENTYHILVGKMNTDIKEIRKIAKGNIILHESVVDVKKLFTEMDLVISAAGSTLYEICACGVPLITFSTADNQILGAEVFEKMGIGVNVGDLRDPISIIPDRVMGVSLENSAVKRIMTATEKLSKDYNKRNLMGRRMQEMIDGFGASRMAQKIFN